MHDVRFWAYYHSVITSCSENFKTMSSFGVLLIATLLHCIAAAPSLDPTPYEFIGASISVVGIMKASKALSSMTAADEECRTSVQGV